MCCCECEGYPEWCVTTEPALVIKQGIEASACQVLLMRPAPNELWSGAPPPARFLDRDDDHR